MALLEDLPHPEYQAILHYLDPHDYSSLRQVSHAVHHLTNQNVSYISLLLSQSSSEKQLREWDQATKQLQHVFSIHVNIEGHISVEMFDLTMQLLSRRRYMKELHLLPARKLGFRCSIPSLQPLARVASQLTSLVISMVTIKSPGKSMIQLAAAAPKAGWELHSLVLESLLDIGVVWLDHVDTVKQLKAVFPRLRNLVLSAPLHDFGLKPTAVPGGRGVLAQQVQLRAAITSVAASINAVLQLKSLESLSLLQLADIWVYDAANRLQAATATPATSTDTGTGALVHRGTLQAMESALDAAEAAILGPSDLNVLLHGGPLPSVAAATEAFATLDECGRWLLQQHPRLRQLQIQTDRGWMMSWKHQGQNHPGKLFHSSSAVALLDSSNMWSVDAAPFQSEAYKGDRNHLCQGPSTTSWSQQFIQHLALYSCTPAPDLIRHIRCCSLGLIHNEVESLVEVLGDLTSLRELQVTLRFDMRRASGPDVSLWRSRVAATAAVVAHMPGLESFDFKVSNAVASVYAPEDLLLPLTAAAGGPGSNLKKLRLVADFSKGMPGMDVSESLKWSVSDRGTNDRPAVPTLVQRIKDSHIAPASLSESSITSLVQYGWSSTFDRLTHAADGITHWQAMAAAGDGSASVVGDSSSTVEVEGKNDSMLGRLWLRLSTLIAGKRLQQQQRQQQKQQQQMPGTIVLMELPVKIYSRQELAAAAMCLGSGWQYVLQQLDGLQELHLIDGAYYGHMDVLVECLPASLKVLRGKRLRITSLATVAGDVPAASDGIASETVLIVSSANQRPQLRELSLYVCQLSSPGVLASKQLTRLTLDEVQWSGSWDHAAAAWPNVRELLWRQYHYDFTLSTLMTFHALNDTSAVEDTFDGPALLQGISAAFNHLRVLHIANMPEECFSFEVLQPVVAHLSSVKQLNIGSSSRTERSAIEKWLHQQLPYANIL